MKTSNHTHELRQYDYRKGLNHFDTLATGKENECLIALQKLVDDNNIKDNARFGVGFYLNNGGYSIVSLKEEQKRRTELAAPELLNALHAAYNTIKANDLLNSICTASTQHTIGEFILEAIEKTKGK